MHLLDRIQRRLDAALDEGTAGGGSPPLLTAAVRHAVFPGGARVRPRLTLAVAMACGDDDPALSDAAAAAVELLHCASLAHDDLPCFDDAPLRRGVASVHAAFGERLAVLAGDALIVLAFQILASAPAYQPLRRAGLIMTIARGVGTPRGIVAGQAWECEPAVELSRYQRAKTGSLFAAATVAGAQAAGGDGSAWRALGEWLGEAYQVADDIRDAVGDARSLGKPTGRDAVLDRPSATRRHGLAASIRRFDALVARAAASIPDCPGAEALREVVRLEAERLVPKAWHIRGNVRIAA